LSNVSRGGANRQALRDEIIAPISGLDVYNVAHVAQLVDVFE
jgi:hypothetical protein